MLSRKALADLQSRLSMLGTSALKTFTEAPTSCAESALDISPARRRFRSWSLHGRSLEHSGSLPDERGLSNDSQTSLKGVRGTLTTKTYMVCIARSQKCPTARRWVPCLDSRSGSNRRKGQARPCRAKRLPAPTRYFLPGP